MRIERRLHSAGNDLDGNSFPFFGVEGIAIYVTLVVDAAIDSDGQRNVLCGSGEVVGRLGFAYQWQVGNEQWSWIGSFLPHWQLEPMHTGWFRARSGPGNDSPVGNKLTQRLN